jgi:DNA-binding response OmpR family regulator
LIKILVVDSDQKRGEDVTKLLHAEEGIVAGNASDRERSLWYLSSETPDAVVVNLGELDGWEQEICGEIRERTIAPLLVLGRRGQEIALAHSLNAGGDAHLLRPFSKEIFLSQLYALLRRVGLTRAGHAGQFDIGTLAVNVYQHEVKVHGRRVEVTPTEFEILRSLLNNAGRPLSYRSLVRQVQGYDCPSDEARQLLKVHIHNLRKKIEPNPDKPAHILNVRGFGYLFERRRFPREILNEPMS